MSEIDPTVSPEVQRRRTFAIIAHPDAGKTTLTEKLLLYGGCVEVAGAVRGRKTDRATASDWMELERQRGISVSSTVLPFEYQGFQVNLLDTPGHHDFSEDTYRTLMAADCAVMVLDTAKGVETQTEKLFRVCAMRKIPVLTFVNKMDRPGKEPLALLQEIESTLGIAAVPFNWPLGTGRNFCGVVDTATSTAQLFVERNANKRLGSQSIPLSDIPEDLLSKDAVAQLAEELELLREAGAVFDQQRFLNGDLSPVFFGSALTNYGVEQFLRAYLQLSPPPGKRPSDVGPVEPARSDFAGFVFKIQANLDPRHRDRVAFVRVCAGRFRREMEILHPRTGKRLRLRRAHRVFGQDRETMDEAFAGDIIGLVNPGEFRLGDTICEGPAVNFDPLPQFSPEFFAVLRPTDTGRRKQFERGLQQLVEEGAVQLFFDPHGARREPMVAAVGELQLDVIRYRLENEYQTTTDISWRPYKLARWLADEAIATDSMRLPTAAKVVVDQHGHKAILFVSQWDANYCQTQNPDVKLCAVRVGSIDAAEVSQSAP